MPRNPTFSDKIAKIRQKSEIPTRYKHCIKLRLESNYEKKLVNTASRHTWLENVGNYLA